jgi:hypothetical protein
MNQSYNGVYDVRSRCITGLVKQTGGSSGNQIPMTLVKHAWLIRQNGAIARTRNGLPITMNVHIATPVE